MVILSACPTRWTAGAAHPCWEYPNRVRSEGERSRSMGCMPPSDLSQLNRWLLKRRRASVLLLMRAAISLSYDG